MGLSATWTATESAPKKQRWLRNALRLLLIILFLSAMTFAGIIGYSKYWPKEIVIHFPAATPIPIFSGGTLQLRPPTSRFTAIIGTFDDELTAYLTFEYIRSLKQVDANRVFLTAREGASGPEYRMYLLLQDNLLTQVPYAEELYAQRYISQVDFVFTTAAQVDHFVTQTMLFTAAYNRPVRNKLDEMSPSQLAANVSRFILFKAKTDRRARERIYPSPSREEAGEMAADIISVSNFYSIPLEFFLGVGAMENNYLDVRGDLEHKVWKRRAEPGDIVLRRRKGRVLVLNYSIGVWQITRETLRYAHRLYLKDTRDYSQLPERLRPPRDLDLEKIDTHVLTTYAGLLIRDLLDRFGGDVPQAIGAYNGGPRNPNPEYAESVTLVADYAKKVLQQAALLNGRAIANTRLTIRRAP